MLITAGYSKETSSQYSWDGLRRGDNQTIVFQYTVAGRGELRFEDEATSLEAGDAFIVTIPHNNHYYLPADSEYWEFIFLCLSGREAVRLVEELIAENGPVFNLDIESIAAQEFIETVRKVYHQEVTSQYQASQLSYTMLMALAHHLRMDSSWTALLDNIKRALTFCEENFKENIGVDEMAEAARYSRYHFSRVFKNAVGMAPGEYLQMQRLKYAAALLSDPTLNIKEQYQRDCFQVRI
ncbi:MAG: helix-turn-helix domain-containing protein [Planctomycetota bacterium]